MIIKEQEIIEKLNNKVKNLSSKRFSINDIKNNDKLDTLYTGLQSYAVFEWLYGGLSHKVLEPRTKL